MADETILIRCPGVVADVFKQELQKGFYINSVEGKTLYLFLTEDCGISDEYISEKIKTILIDGGPVDDIFKTRIHAGGICALSGAMPGIAGAMMRIGSPYAAMRESITVKPDNTDNPVKQIKAGLKLFNTILADKGYSFLKNGIIIEKQRITDLFKKHSGEIFSDLVEVEINGSDFGKSLFEESGLGAIGDYAILKVEINSEN